MHQSREMDWRRTTNVFVFLLLVIAIAVAIGAMMWMLLPQPSHAQDNACPADRPIPRDVFDPASGSTITCNAVLNLKLMCPRDGGVCSYVNEPICTKPSVVKRCFTEAEIAAAEGRQ